MIVKPSIKRIRHEANRIKQKLVDEQLLSDIKGMKNDEIIKKYEPALWEYLSNLYSYDSTCAIKVFTFDDPVRAKIDGVINDKYDSLKHVAQTFGDDVELERHYISKIDENAGLNEYKKIWYVYFHKKSYVYGYDQVREYIATTHEVVLLKDNIAIIVGQSSKLPTLKDKFMLDFGLTADMFKDIAEMNDLFALFNEIKKHDDDDVSLRTHEVKKDNPIKGIKAGYITLSEPIGESEDIDDFSDDDEIAQMLSDAKELSKTLKYCYRYDEEYEECAKILIGKGEKSIRVHNKMSDEALFVLADRIIKAIDGLQENTDHLPHSESDTQA